jgi:acetylglutamate kinase
MNQAVIPDTTDLLESFLANQDEYNNVPIGIKFGGALAEDETIVREIARQAAILSKNGRGPKLFFVHGGGKQIDEALTSARIDIKKDARNVRITDPETMTVCDDELRVLNGKITRIFNQVAPHVQAVGMAGYDAKLITGVPVDRKNRNFTGSITNVNIGYLKKILNRAAGHSVIPIIYPICHSPEARESDFRINVNADDVIAALCVHMGARRMILLSDIPGILDQQKQLITEIHPDDITPLIQNGTITGGMIPKAESMRDVTLKLGESGGVAVVDGRKRSALINEILGQGGGTLVSSKAAPLRF